MIATQPPVQDEVFSPSRLLSKLKTVLQDSEEAMQLFNENVPEL